MSDKWKRAAIAFMGVVFAVSAALLQVPAIASMPKVHQGLEILLSVLGALGLGVTKPIFSQAAPAGLPLPDPGVKTIDVSKR